MREACEETGLSDLRLVGYVGTADDDLRPARHEVHERHFFHFIAPDDTPDEWLWFEDRDGLQEPTAFLFSWLSITKGHVLAAGMGAVLSRVVIL